MPSAGFKPAFPAIKRLQTYALDRMATGIGKLRYCFIKYYSVSQIKEITWADHAGDENFKFCLGRRKGTGLLGDVDLRSKIISDGCYANRDQWRALV
jgi:hypothetical protein